MLLYMNKNILTLTMNKKYFDFETLINSQYPRGMSLILTPFMVGKISLKVCNFRHLKAIIILCKLSVIYCYANYKSVSSNVP